VEGVLEKGLWRENGTGVGFEREIPKNAGKGRSSKQQRVSQRKDHPRTRNLIEEEKLRISISKYYRLSLMEGSCGEGIII